MGTCHRDCEAYKTLISKAKVLSKRPPTGQLTLLLVIFIIILLIIIVRLLIQVAHLLPSEVLKFFLQPEVIP
jgi:hypothetical protein